MGPKPYSMQKLLYKNRAITPTKVSQGRMPVDAALTAVPTRNLEEATRKAVQGGALDSRSLTKVLLQFQRFKRLDRSERVLREYAKQRGKLSVFHFTVLMAHCVDELRWEKALATWGRMLARRIAPTAVTHGVLLKALEQSGQWEQVLRHYAKLVHEEKAPLDVKAVHTVMHTARRSPVWTAAFSVFSTAVDRGLAPDVPVYLELMHTLKDQPRSFSSAWYYSLHILGAVKNVYGFNVGLCNAALATLDTHARWAEGLQLYGAMEPSNTPPNKATMDVLFSLCRYDPHRIVSALGEAHRHSVPVTDEMYRLLFTQLFARGMAADSLALFKAEKELALADTGSPSSSLQAMYSGLVDSLMVCPDADVAEAMFDEVGAEVGSAVGKLTHGLGTVGLASQRWTVEGRVGVADHTVLQSKLFFTLVHHYDSVIVPFSAVRSFVRKLSLLGNHSKEYIELTGQLESLKKELLTRKCAMIRVLPLRHEVHSHRYLVPARDDASELRRALAARDAPAAGDDEIAIRLPGEVTGESKGEEKRPSLERSKIPSLKHEAARVLGVAAMLARLNPDASVHVLSANTKTIASCRDAVPNVLSGQLRVTTVRFPSQLNALAPVAPRQRQGTSTRKAATPARQPGGFVAPS